MWPIVSKVLHILGVDLLIYFLALFIVNFTMGDTFQAFGVIYVGLLDLHSAGEFTTSLTSMVHSDVSVTSY